MKKINLFLFSLVTMVTLSVELSSCGSGNNSNKGSNNNNSSSNSNNSSKIDLSNISSADDAKKYIDGKTFIATPSGKLWYKVTFSNGSYTFWTSIPTAGGWGNPEFQGSYNIKEKRFSDTGKKFYYVTFSDDDYSMNCTKFIITDLSFLNCNAYDSSDRAYATEGDRNPWN